MMEYEALIKVRNSKNKSLSKEEQQSQLYKAGDIVVVRPKGWKWGRREVKVFLIVNLGEMTEEEAIALEQPQVENEEIICRRKYKVDLRQLMKSIKKPERMKIFDSKVEFQPHKDEVITYAIKSSI